MFIFQISATELEYPDYMPNELSNHSNLASPAPGMPNYNRHMQSNLRQVPSNDPPLVGFYSVTCLVCGFD